MSASYHTNKNFEWRTMKTSRGITLPMKIFDGCDIKFWSCDLNNMPEHIIYLKNDFIVRDSDVFICTYPRSGTNWTHEIVNMLLKGTKLAPYFSFVETVMGKTLDAMASPRILCTHLPLRYLPPKAIDIAKVICVFRNPKDIVVSLHNLLGKLSILDYDASFEDFLQLFLEGEVPDGLWFDHVLDWERAINEYKSASILTLYYEDMKKNLLDNVEKLANFLKVSCNKDVVEEIAKNCDFNFQYKERTSNAPEFAEMLSRNTSNAFYRKGEVGDWKNWFTVAQNEEFDKVYNKKMKDSKLKIRFSLE